MVERCSRCVTPQTWPGIRFDRQGVCNLCRAFERRWAHWLVSDEARRRSLAELDSLVRKAKLHAQRNYDVMVPISGGKDSLYVLYWLKKHFDLRILTYTYDNGLLDPRARENIAKATQVLGVRHVMDTLPFQHELLRHFLERTGNFCGACVIPYLIGAHRLAIAQDVPLLVFGLSKRTDSNPPDGMNPFYFFNVVNDGFGAGRFQPHWGPHPIQDYLKDLALGRHHVINLPDYLPWDEDAIAKELTDNLGVNLAEEHFDCIGHETAYWLTTRRYGFPTSVVKYSQKIRCGTMQRDQALRMLEAEADRFPQSATEVADLLGIKTSRIQEATTQSMKPYFRGVGNFLAVQHRKWFLGR